MNHCHPVLGTTSHNRQKQIHCVSHLITISHSFHPTWKTQLETDKTEPENERHKRYPRARDEPFAANASPPTFSVRELTLRHATGRIILTLIGLQLVAMAPIRSSALVLRVSKGQNATQSPLRQPAIYLGVAIAHGPWRQLA